MKKLVLFLAVLLQSITSLSQDDDRLRFYKLDGTEYIIKEEKPITVKYFLDNYLKEEKFTFAHTDFSIETILAVYYREFSNTPLFILGNKPSAYEIKTAISTFDYGKYLKNWQFDYNLKKEINAGNLIIDDLYKIFGKPNDRIETANITVFKYDNLKLNFTIQNYKVIDFLHY